MEQGAQQPVNEGEPLRDDKTENTNGAMEIDIESLERPTPEEIAMLVHFARQGLEKSVQKDKHMIPWIVIALLAGGVMTGIAASQRSFIPLILTLLTMLFNMSLAKVTKNL